MSHCFAPWIQVPSPHWNSSGWQVTRALRQHIQASATQNSVICVVPFSHVPLTLLGLHSLSANVRVLAASTKATEAAAASATVLLCPSAIPHHPLPPWENKAHMSTPCQNRLSASSEASLVRQNKASRQQNSQQWSSSGGCSLCEARLLSSWECTVTLGRQRQLLLSSPSFTKNYI